MQYSSTNCKQLDHQHHNNRNKPNTKPSVRIQNRQQHCEMWRATKEKIQRSEAEAMGEVGCRDKRSIQSSKSVVRNFWHSRSSSQSLWPSLLRFRGNKAKLNFPENVRIRQPHSVDPPPTHFSISHNSSSSSGGFAPIPSSTESIVHTEDHSTLQGSHASGNFYDFSSQFSDFPISLYDQMIASSATASHLQASPSPSASYSSSSSTFASSVTSPQAAPIPSVYASQLPAWSSGYSSSPSGWYYSILFLSIFPRIKRFLYGFSPMRVLWFDALHEHENLWFFFNNYTLFTFRILILKDRDFVIWVTPFLVYWSHLLL